MAITLGTFTQLDDGVLTGTFKTLNVTASLAIVPIGRDAAVPSRQGEPRLKRPSPAMTGSTAPPRARANMADCLFLSARGRRIIYPVVNRAFRDIIRFADIAPGRARRPRIHDLRHTFATRVLEQCGGAGREAIARHAVALMTYMGHSDLRYTYWYLQATPELMTDIAAAAEALVAGEVR